MPRILLSFFPRRDPLDTSREDLDITSGVSHEDVRRSDDPKFRGMGLAQETRSAIRILPVVRVALDV
jgi:hypothetical protein